MPYLVAPASRMNVPMTAQTFTATGQSTRESTNRPITPQPPNPLGSHVARREQVDSETSRLTPPQGHAPQLSQGKSRTPTPTYSHISTPPPTVAVEGSRAENRLVESGAIQGDNDETARMTPEDLRKNLIAAQTSLRAAQMSAAHYKLQYQMLSQESAVALERMAVEEQLTHDENEFIRRSEQAKFAAPVMPVAPLIPDGMITVQKDLYGHMCRELQRLASLTQALEGERGRQEQIIEEQESQIASLGDRIILMRERIRESREHLQRYRADIDIADDCLTPGRGIKRRRSRQEPSEQPFAALLQASELASRAAHNAETTRKGHMRNTHSLSSLPTTPQRSKKARSMFSTPLASAPHQAQVPATAPQARISRPHDMDDARRIASGSRMPPSDGTVSAAEEDSEAETEILEDHEIGESQASATASRMLRESQGDQESRLKDMKGPGLLKYRPGPNKQTTLFGVVRKRNIDRDDLESDKKRKRTGEEAVGLGIEGVPT